MIHWYAPNECKIHTHVEYATDLASCASLLVVLSVSATTGKGLEALKGGFKDVCLIVQS